MNRICSFVAALLLFALAVPVRVPAQSVPMIMTFQGRLAKPDGTPVADVTSQSLTFRLYSAASGGTLLWQQSGTLPVRNGTFAARFDFSTGFTTGNTLVSVFSGSPVYLEIQVGTDAPLAPRQLLTSNAYAFTALNALAVAVGSVGLNALASGVLNFTNLSGQISSSQIASGSITGDKLASGTITSDKIAGGTIGLGNLATSLQQMLGSFGAGPVQVGSVGTDGSPSSVAVAGNYACVVNPNSNTLQVFDVSDPTSPIFQGRASTRPRSYPSSVAVAGRTAYVVNYGTDSLQVFDVSNATAPTLKGSVGTGSFPRSVVVAGNTAYVVNVGSSSLQVFDVSNPATPTLKGSVGTDGSPSSVAVSGSTAYVVNFGSNSSLQVFDVSDSTSPTLKGSASTGINPQSVAVSGNYAYVVNFKNSNLQVFDVSNPAAPTLKGSVGTDSHPRSVVVSGSTAYVVNEGSNALQVFEYGLNLRGGLSTDAVIANGSIVVNNSATNNGALPPGLLFGGISSGEGIAGKRTAGDNQFGLDFFTGGVSRLSITQGGNVGIGTNAPAYALDVNGNIHVGGSGNGLVFPDGTLQTTAASFSGTTAGGELSGTYPNPTIATNAVTSTKLASDAASLLKVSGGALTSSNGNVGIGTTTPNFPLSFPNTLGDKISLWGQTSSYYGLGVQGNLLQIHSDISNSDVAFGYGSSAAFIETMRIKGNGNVGIGTTAPSYKLDVSGQVRASNVSVTSDARYKSHIATFPNALDTILGLRGVTFDWNRDLWQDKGFAAGRQVGFIAQEVESVLPELVTTDAIGYKAVAYQNVVPVLVEAVKTLKKDNDALKADNVAIKSENAAMKARLDAIEKLLLRRKP